MAEIWNGPFSSSSMSQPLQLQAHSGLDGVLSHQLGELIEGDVHDVDELVVRGHVRRTPFARNNGEDLETPFESTRVH